VEALRRAAGMEPALVSMPRHGILAAGGPRLTEPRRQVDYTFDDRLLVSA
jgi:hypothetical protein